MARGSDYKIKKIEKGPLQRFKNQNLIIKKFGEAGLKVYKAITGKRTTKELRSDLELEQKNFDKIINYMAEAGMVELEPTGKEERPSKKGARKLEEIPPEEELEPEEEVPPLEEEPAEELEEVSFEAEEAPEEEIEEEPKEKKRKKRAEEEEELAFDEITPIEFEEPEEEPPPEEEEEPPPEGEEEPEEEPAEEYGGEGEEYEEIEPVQGGPCADQSGVFAVPEEEVGFDVLGGAVAPGDADGSYGLVCGTAVGTCDAGCGKSAVGARGPKHPLGHRDADVPTHGTGAVDLLNRDTEARRFRHVAVCDQPLEKDPARPRDRDNL